MTLVFYANASAIPHDILTLCEMGTQYVESSVECPKQFENVEIPCSVTRMSGIPGYDQRTNLTAFDMGQNYLMFQHIRYTLTSLVDVTNGFLEKWLVNPPDGFKRSDDGSWEDVPLDLFSNRLAMILNTHLHASLDSSILLGYTDVTPKNSTWQWQNTTAAWTQFTALIYHLRRSWFVLFAVSTAILSVCAIANLALRCLIRVPDFIGSVSALTRDSPFIVVPTPWSTLDGAERARLLRDKWVAIGDVKPEEPVGRIALSDAETFANLTPGRKYE